MSDLFIDHAEPFFHYEVEAKKVSKVTTFHRSFYENKLHIAYIYI